MGYREFLNDLPLLNDKENFRQGAHWQVVEGDGDILWIFFSTAARRIGSFNLFASSKLLPGVKLFVGDPDNLYYQTMIDPTRSLIQTLAREGNFKRVIFWGSSMGAYASLLFGLTAEVAAEKRIYAFSPQLYLKHNDTHATHYIKDGRHLDPRYTDLRPLLRECGFAGICSFFPIIEFADLPQAADIQTFSVAAPQVWFTRTSHRVIDQVRDAGPPNIVRLWLEAAARGEPLQLPEAFVAKRDDLKMLEIQLARLDGRISSFGPEDVQLDDSSYCSEFWFNTKMRILESGGEFENAIAAGLASIELHPSHPDHTFSLANCMNGSGQRKYKIMADAFYRRAVRLSPENRLFRDGLVQYLRDIGMADEASRLSAPSAPA